MMINTCSRQHVEICRDEAMRQLQDYCAAFIVPQRDKPKEFGGNTPWCRIEDIQGKYLNGTRSGQYVSEETIKKMNLKVIPEGAVICSCSASIGVQAIVVSPCITNQTFIGIVPKEELNKEFLYYLLKSKSAYFKKIGTGTTIPYISRKKFEQLPVPGLTLTEQTKVVRILNHAEMIIEHRKKELLRLDELVKARFVEMFGDPVDNPIGWKTKTLQELVSDDCTISYGIVQTGDDQEEGIPVFRPVDIVNHIPVRTELKRTTEEISSRYKRTILKGREMLITVRANIADTCIVGEEFVGCNVGRGIVPIRTKEDEMVLEFLKYQIDSKHLNDNIKALAKGITLIQLNMEDLREISLIVPPIEIQKVYVEFTKQVDKSKQAREYSGKLAA